MSDSTYQLGSYDGGLKYSAHFRQEMTSWVIERLGAKNLLELGCGPGYFLEAYGLDFPFMGIDGCPVPPEALRIPQRNFLCLDLTSVTDLRPYLLPEFGGHVDCLMSLEMLEHWPRAADCEFFRLLRTTSPRKVILSVARPDQKPMPGESHPNCQEVDDVIEKMHGIGYTLDVGASDSLRSLMLAPTELLLRRPWADFYQRNTRVYERA